MHEEKNGKKDNGKYTDWLQKCRSPLAPGVVLLRQNYCSTVLIGVLNQVVVQESKI